MVRDYQYEIGPWERDSGIVRSATTLRPVAEVIRTNDDGTANTRWQYNERLIVLAPEMADCLRMLKDLLQTRYDRRSNYGPLVVERETIETAERLLNGAGRLQVRAEMKDGTMYVKVLVTERRCHLMLNETSTICRRPVEKDGNEYVKEVSWQAACELSDCPGCKAFMPHVEL
jgi:hypothetical protein